MEKNGLRRELGLLRATMLGIGGFVALLAYLVRSGFISLSPNLTEVTTYILIFISLVHVLAGILNITAKS